jgi:phosphoribosylamine---glycine ligase
MNILLLGSGGREHAFAWKILQSKKCDKLFVAPGNAGTGLIAENVPLSITDFEAIKNFVVKHSIELLVVGPEEPLVKGIVDFLKKDPSTQDLAVVGPDSFGAQLEGSKDFSKKFMQRHQIPTAAYETFTANTISDGIDFINSQSLPIVLKADGLAAGKGVLICQNHEEAIQSFREMLLDKKFGTASEKVVVEQFLSGIELSVFVATDGNSYRILPEAKDYKRIFDGDQGLNTGGMGAVSPVHFADAEFLRKVEENIVKPSILGIEKEGINFKGFLFIGLMNVNGEPFVIEYNVRMGDPETEAVLPRIKSDFVELLQGIATGKLHEYSLEISSKFATTVVMVAGGYPGDYKKGEVITGLTSQDPTENVVVFHAGTSTSAQNEILTNGGRVLAITGLGNSVEEALDAAYQEVSKIHWNNVHYRKDIGQDILGLIKHA